MVGSKLSRKHKWTRWYTLLIYNCCLFCSVLYSCFLYSGSRYLGEVCKWKLVTLRGVFNNAFTSFFAFASKLWGSTRNAQWVSAELRISCLCGCWTSSCISRGHGHALTAALRRFESHLLDLFCFITVWSIMSGRQPWRLLTSRPVRIPSWQNISDSWAMCDGKHND